tara:strand:- start:26216 stop:27334 length:1119 start_codon:yes stop_codon:yes gene_type:complete
MSIKKYIANKDNTITNAFKENLQTRAEDANMGASDIIEVFSIYGQATTSSAEQARIIIEFPISQIAADRSDSKIPASGSVNFVLKLTNAEHSSTTPSSFTLNVGAISNSWSEGTGLDMEGYTDTGASNWVSRSLGLTWGASGGDVLSGQYLKDVVFDSGTENLELDISNIVEDWIDGTINQYGLLIKLSGSAENVIGGVDPIAKKSYYTKKFFARQSQYFFKRPIIEARWDNSSLGSGSLPDPYVRADEYIYNITNLKSSYKAYENITFKVNTRKKDWQPNIYTVATNKAPTDLVDETYYKIRRVADNHVVINYSTASTPSYSKLSYNATGSYFDFNMSNLEPNYLYEISFLRKNENNYIEQKEKFKFRVDP